MSDARRQNEDERTVLKYVRYLVSQGANVNAGHNTPAPLRDAVVAGYFEVVRFLIAKGADVNVGGGVSPLRVAVDNNNIEMVRFLTDHGADVNRHLPLFDAVQNGNLEMVKLLVSRGADVNVEYRNSTLIFEPRGEGMDAGPDVRNPNPAIVDFLVSQGAR